MFGKRLVVMDVCRMENVLCAWVQLTKIMIYVDGRKMQKREGIFAVLSVIALLPRLRDRRPA